MPSVDWYLTELKMPNAPSGVKPEPWELIGFFSQEHGRNLSDVPAWVLEVWTSENRLDYSARPNSLHLRGSTFYYRIDFQTVSDVRINQGSKEVDLYIYRRLR